MIQSIFIGKKNILQLKAYKNEVLASEQVYTLSNSDAVIYHVEMAI